MATDVDFVDDPDKDVDADFEGDVALEAKYAAQMRQIHPQKIELPISALRVMVDEQIKLNPDFQRRDRWDVKMQSRFVESIIMNVPVPPVFLGEDSYGRYVVLDGRQRLTAIYEFLTNRYPLAKLEVWKELSGMRFTDLEDKGLAPTLKRRFIPAVLLLRESSPEVKYDVFDRLNTGGVALNSMEIRNAVFQGKFNRLVHQLSDDHTFRALWDIPLDDAERRGNTLYSQMRDVELVVRFFALRDPSAIRRNFKWWLGSYMDQQNKAADSNPAVLDDDKQAFRRAVHAINRVFGAPEAFVRTDGGKRSKSAPLSDALMVAFSHLDPAKIDDGTAATLKGEFANMIANDADFKAAITTGTNGKGAIGIRVGRAIDLVTRIAPGALWR